jgi:hypothetical protein
MRCCNYCKKNISVAPVITSSDELFQAAMNKMIKLDYSKLGILIGYRRPNCVGRGLLGPIHSCKLSEGNTNIIQASFFSQNSVILYSGLKSIMFYTYY